MLTVNNAVAILHLVGCDKDPILRDGRESTPRFLSESLGQDDAKQLWIKFYVEGIKRRGTLYSMVLNRLQTA